MKENTFSEEKNILKFCAISIEIFAGFWYDIR